MPWLYLLAAWVFAFVLMAAAYEQWNRSGLRLSLRITEVHPAEDSPVGDIASPWLRSPPQPAALFEGDAVELEVSIQTKGAARGPAWVTGRLGDDEVHAASAVVPRSGWRKPFVSGALRRGPLTAASWMVGSSDPLGLFSSGRPQADSEVALVLPRFGALAASNQVRELEASLAAPHAGSGSELFGVREYFPGDPLRRIHWRATARHGELVVREYEPPGALTLGIFCDPEPRNREVADQIARIAASEAWDCIRSGGRVMLWGPGLVASATLDARSFWSLLEWLARYPTSSAGGGDDAPRAAEAVAVAGTSRPDLADALEAARRRGSLVRAWMVGDADFDVDAPTRHVGTVWPL
ncbi:MAG: DUF58 domain-containing protein [Candidatus Dormibacterales bacterium]